MARVKNTLGIDIGGTNIKAALVQGGKIVKRMRVPTHAEQGLQTSLGQIKSVLLAFVDYCDRVGIGIAGMIDSKRGVVKFSPNLIGWKNIPLASILQSEFNKPVRILNDVDAICLGEWQYGAGKGHDNVFLFTLGTGVGGAAICEGLPLFGAHGFAGEFGHSVIVADGPHCPCGNRGCLERYVGAQYIVARARKMMKKAGTALRKHSKLTPRIIAAEAKKGDKIARAVFEETAYYIGIGITNIIALFDPSVIIISGGIARAGKTLFEPVRTVVAQRVMGVTYRTYKIIPSKLGDDAGILGAVYYVRNPSF